MNPALLLEFSEEEEAFGFWLLAFGFWLLAFGFRRWVVSWDGVDPDKLVLAYIINDSVLVDKTADGERIAPKHRRWGIMQHTAPPGSNLSAGAAEPQWNPLGFGFYYEPAEAIPRPA